MKAERTRKALEIMIMATDLPIPDFESKKVDEELEELERKSDFVDKMISPNANEIYNELEMLKEKANKWDEKETPYIIQEYYSDGTTRQGFCQCTAVVRESEMYCWSCGKRITFESDGE